MMTVSKFLMCLAGAGLGLAIRFADPASAAPPPAAAPTISASQLAAARRVVLLSGISRSFDVFVPQLSAQITQLITRTRPELADDLEVVLKQLQPEFQAHQSEIIDEAAQIYSYHMTESELNETVAFFSTPTGRKYVETEPVVLNDLVAAIHDWSRQLSQIMLTRVREEMKKKGHDL